MTPAKPSPELRELSDSEAEADAVNQVRSLFDASADEVDEQLQLQPAYLSRRSTGSSRSASKKRRPSKQPFVATDDQARDAPESSRPMSEDAHPTRPVSHSGRTTKVVSSLSLLDASESRESMTGDALASQFTLMDSFESSRPKTGEALGTRPVSGSGPAAEAGHLLSLSLFHADSLSAFDVF